MRRQWDQPQSSDRRELENVCTVRCLTTYLRRLEPEEIPLPKADGLHTKITADEDCLWWARDSVSSQPIRPHTQAETLELALQFVQQAQILKPTLKWIVGEAAHSSVLSNVSLHGQ